MTIAINKNQRGAASQYFVAAELCRRGHPASITMGNTAHVDILCSNASCTRFVHIQVKTYRPSKNGGGTCQVGMKAETDYGPNFFWVLCGYPDAPDEQPKFFVIPSRVMAREVSAEFEKWVNAPGRNGRPHDPKNKMRVVHIPPKSNAFSWDMSEFEGAWHLIDDTLNAPLDKVQDRVSDTF